MAPTVKFSGLTGPVFINKFGIRQAKFWNKWTTNSREDANLWSIAETLPKTNVDYAQANLKAKPKIQNFY